MENTMHTTLHDTCRLGQSLWLDTISRALLTSGELNGWIEKGVLGVTTNPAIFEQAIARTVDYDEDIRDLTAQGKSAAEIYESLTLQEVQAAADALRPVYERTGARDGYVSLEVNPLLAANVTSTVSEAGRLFRELDRPNVMIKIPATPEGIQAVEQCVAQGINVNATLIFSADQYADVAQAYINGLIAAVSAGCPPEAASVASVFVSRVDSAVDALLEADGNTDPAVLNSLKGHTAVDNARLIYQKYKEIFNPQKAPWQGLAALGANTQRPLWASTGTKNPGYSDILYVESLIGPDTVNTVPPGTLRAFLEHGRPALTLESSLCEAWSRQERLAQIGIDLDAICSTLMKDGVEAFEFAFRSLMESIEDRMTGKK